MRSKSSRRRRARNVGRWTLPHSSSSRHRLRLSWVPSRRSRTCLPCSNTTVSGPGGVDGVLKSKNAAGGGGACGGAGGAAGGEGGGVGSKRLHVTATSSMAASANHVGP
eukprot:2487309-Prymnesium_polylepis.1